MYKQGQDRGIGLLGTIIIIIIIVLILTVALSGGFENFFSSVQKCNGNCRDAAIGCEKGELLAPANFKCEAVEDKAQVCCVGKEPENNGVVVVPTPNPEEDNPSPDENLVQNNVIEIRQGTSTDKVSLGKEFSVKSGEKLTLYFWAEGPAIKDCDISIVEKTSNNLPLPLSGVRNDKHTISTCGHTKKVENHLTADGIYFAEFNPIYLDGGENIYKVTFTLNPTEGGEPQGAWIYLKVIK